MSRLENFNIAFFAVTLGILGVAIAFHRAGGVLGFGGVFGTILFYAGSVIFATATLLYVIKIITNFRGAKADWAHPTKSNFFPAFSISLILMSILLLHKNLDIAFYFWGAGSLLHFIFTVAALSKWVRQGVDINMMNPSWFIPVVGNILVPVSGVHLFNPEVSWFFFSIGFVFWIVLFTIVIYRVVFHNPLPEKLSPTLFILIAPPAVGFISYLKLVGEIDAFSKVLYYFALFFLVLLLVNFKMFYKIKFFLSWWAYSFPMAAMTIATLLYYENTGLVFFKWLSAIMAVIMLLILVVLVINTLKAITRKEICVATD